MSAETANDFRNVMLRRRAIRAYRPEQPSDDVIGELLEAAVQAPTAMHLEPWGFAVIQDRALLKQLSDRAKGMLLDSSTHMAVGWGSVGTGKHPATPGHDHRAMLADPKFNIFYDAGTLIVICRTMSGPFADADCWLAAQNLMLAATVRSLGTCCIGFSIPVLNAADVKRQLGVPEDGAAVAPVIVGTPSHAAAAVPRKPPRVLRWIK